jgi:hypothetical protein
LVKNKRNEDRNKDHPKDGQKIGQRNYSRTGGHLVVTALRKQRWERAPRNLAAVQL